MALKHSRSTKGRSRTEARVREDQKASKPSDFFLVSYTFHNNIRLQPAAKSDRETSLRDEELEMNHLCESLGTLVQKVRLLAPGAALPRALVPNR